MKEYRIREVRQTDDSIKYIAEYRVKRFWGWGSWNFCCGNFKWSIPYKFDTIEEPIKLIDDFKKGDEIRSEKSVYHYV